MAAVRIPRRPSGSESITNSSDVRHSHAARADGKDTKLTKFTKLTKKSACMVVASSFSDMGIRFAASFGIQSRARAERGLNSQQDAVGLTALRAE
jgi:hypothetical protein